MQFLKDLALNSDVEICHAIADEILSARYLDDDTCLSEMLLRCSVNDAYKIDTTEVQKVSDTIAQLAKMKPAEVYQSVRPLIEKTKVAQNRTIKNHWKILEQNYTRLYQ